jgi:hypothetical protein
MTTKLPLVPEDISREDERRRRQAYIRRLRAELARCGNLETREARFARREEECYRLIASQLMQLAPGDPPISVLPKLCAHLLDQVDGEIAIAVDELRRELKGNPHDR